jgi:hypothetical protein
VQGRDNIFIRGKGEGGERVKRYPGFLFYLSPFNSPFLLKVVEVRIIVERNCQSWQRPTR